MGRVYFIHGRALTEKEIRERDRRSGRDRRRRALLYWRGVRERRSGIERRQGALGA